MCAKLSIILQICKSKMPITKDFAYFETKIAYFETQLRIFDYLCSRHEDWND